MTDHPTLSLQFPGMQTPSALDCVATGHYPAGSVRRPKVDTAAEPIRDLAFDMIRILDDAGKAVGEWAADLPEVDLLAGLRHMMTLRAYDTRMLMAQRQGKTSFYMQHRGEEAISCAFQRVLAPGDMNFPTYRQAGLLIAAGYPLINMMCQVYSNDGDAARGRQLPVFYSARSHGFFSISGNLATQYVQAVGWAMASVQGSVRFWSSWDFEFAGPHRSFEALPNHICCGHRLHRRCATSAACPR